MSWFKRKPPKHPPVSKHHSHPHRSSPASERMMEEAKETGPLKKNKKVKSL
jgi:hypothetical protein